MQVSKLILSPETIDCIVFWTKNPAPMLDNLKLIQNYNYYFHFTITAYDSTIEKNLPEKKTLIETFSRLSGMISADRIIWRYDPVFFTPEFSQLKHLHIFEHLAKKLSGYTRTCIFSYLTPYNKCKKNMQQLQYSVPEIQQGITFARTLNSIAESQKITLKSCAMSREFSDAGIVQGRCIDPELIEKISGKKIDHRKDVSQRENCRCAPSVDIGVYNTCTNGCIYCYANYNHDMAAENYSLHNPGSELLYGTISGNEKISVRNAENKSSSDPDQLKMF